MPDATQALASPAPRQPIERSKPGKITGRLRKALDAMVWQALARDDAAKAAGLTPHALYCALRKPHVRAAYLAECEVLRTSGRAKRLHRLDELAMQSTNLNAAVAAIKVAEGLGDDQAATNRTGATIPGVTIIIGDRSAPVTIDGKAMTLDGASDTTTVD